MCSEVGLTEKENGVTNKATVHRRLRPGTPCRKDSSSVGDPHRRMGHFWRGAGSILPEKYGERPKNELQN